MDFKEVCCNIRSCLNSSKSQLSMAQLMRDYHEVLGESIPFRSLGYNSVESLLRAVPNLRISSVRGEMFIDVKPDEKTAHIANLVCEQRSAKKKKKKPSRGFNCGGPPPPRRPATIPPPKRLAPSSREYYPLRRKDSPPKQTYQNYQHQRRQSPPCRTERDYYFKKRDSPPYLDHRNSASIEISSDEDNGCSYNSRQARNVDDLSRKYYSQPRQYNFSDPNDDNNDDASDLEDCDEINNQMEVLKVTLGEDRQVSINKPKLRSYPSNTSNEDDIGYSSMKMGENVKSHYRTISSDSYDYDDDEEDNAGSTTTTTTSTVQLGSRNKYSPAPGGNPHRRSFNNCSRSNIYYSDNFSTYWNSSRGRGSLLENYRKSSAAGSRGPKTIQNNRGGNIKVTVPNGSGRGRVNEINPITNECLSSETSSKGKGDTLTRTRMNVSRGPAALLAAGRAMQEPNMKSTEIQSPEQKLPPHPVHGFIKNYLSKNSSTHDDCNPAPASILTSTSTHREPFKAMNKSCVSVIGNKQSSSSKSPAEITKPDSKPVVKGSKMSDSNMFKPGPHVQPDLVSQLFCAKLHDFVIQHSLKPPQYKTFVKFCPKTNVASYMCKIKIGSSLSFTSCPYESSLVKDVQDYTAKIALDELQKRYVNIDSTSLPVTTDENMIIKRIAEIVNPHSSGLKSDTIESKYKLLHQQILPLDWLDVVKNRSLLSVEELMGGIMAVYPIEGGMNALLDISKLPPLVLPENEVWNVYITCCISTSCIYFRIVHDDYNGVYAVMDEKMSEVYKMKRHSGDLRHVEMVKEGSYYAAYMDGAWFRVKALSTVLDDKIKICLIDHGDIDEVLKERLFPLDERFTSLPAQKVSCSLTGLEEYSKELYVTRIVSEMTCGKVFVARVDTRNPSLQLTLVDTSTNDDIVINLIIEERIKKELEPPKIPSKSNVTEANLVSVKEDGLAYVQIYSESFKLLKNFLDKASEELECNYENYCVKSVTELLGSKIFLAKYMFDGKWYRVIVDRVVNEEHIEVLFIDFGNLDVVTLKDIVDADHFTEALSIMPNQAVQVRLVKPNEELITENVMQFLMDLSMPKQTPDPTLFLLKTVKEGAIPDVYLFYRLPHTNQPVNVNDIIATYFPEFRSANYTSVELSIETLERVFPIPSYNVPHSEQFSVYVTMVSSPFNFIVQPQANAVDLTELKSAMNDFYNKEVPFVDVMRIKENETYAVKNNKDRMWYRGLVVTLMPVYNSISVKLVDFGEIITVPYSNIAQLLPCFRTLPKQAIKAELAGVTPLHSDWYVDDSLRFKELVSEKLLISFVVDVLEDGKISIILYDTSTVPEIDVGAVLVEEGRAKDITTQGN